MKFHLEMGKPPLTALVRHSDGVTIHTWRVNALFRLFKHFHYGNRRVSQRGADAYNE